LEQLFRVTLEQRNTEVKSIVELILLVS
jgi:hypothetical protein